MIKSIKLTGYEIHNNTKIPFSSGVNLITGPSDNGKSSIIKAIEWVFNNQPSGTGMVQFGKDKVSVTIHTDDRFRVTREVVLTKSRKPKQNLYRLNRETYKAVGKRVPEEVKTALNLSEINIQSQFDNFFLLQDTPGIVAQKFNDVMGLGVIDESLKKANTIVNKARIDSLSCQKTLSGIMEELEEFSDFEAIEKRVKRVGELAKIKADREEKTDKVKRFLAEYKKQEERKKEAARKVEKAAFVEKAEELIKKKKEAEEKARKIKKLLSQFREEKEILTEIKAWLEIEEKIKGLETLLAQKRKAEEKAKKGRSFLKKYNTAVHTLKESDKRLKKAQNELSEWKKRNPTCPTCGSEWK